MSKTVYQNILKICMSQIIMIIFVQTIGTAQTQSTQMYNGVDLSKLSGPYLGQEVPGTTPKLFAPGIISKNNQHSSVYFTKDGLEAYYSDYDREDPKIMVIKATNESWSKPEIAVSGLTPYISPDGNKLFFSTDRLFVCNRTREGWSEPIDLGDEINFQKRQDGASLDSKGNFYFMSMFGSKDGTYVSEILNGKYQPPVKLDISVKGNRMSGGYPALAPDNSYLIFMSWTDKTGYGMQDLYVVFRKKDGAWTDSINLGKKINTQHSESFPFISNDGKYLFFNSNRPSILNNKSGGQFFRNIYWIDASFINDLKPDNMDR